MVESVDYLKIRLLIEITNRKFLILTLFRVQTRLTNKYRTFTNHVPPSIVKIYFVVIVMVRSNSAPGDI